MGGLLRKTWRPPDDGWSWQGWDHGSWQDRRSSWTSTSEDSWWPSWKMTEHSVLFCLPPNAQSMTPVGNCLVTARTPSKVLAFPKLPIQNRRRAEAMPAPWGSCPALRASCCGLWASSRNLALMLVRWVQASAGQVGGSDFVACGLQAESWPLLVTRALPSAEYPPGRLQ